LVPLNVIRAQEWQNMCIGLVPKSFKSFGEFLDHGWRYPLPQCGDTVQRVRLIINFTPLSAVPQQQPYVQVWYDDRCIVHDQPFNDIGLPVNEPVYPIVCAGQSVDLTVTIDAPINTTLVTTLPTPALAAATAVTTLATE
jgi:hypothetical protein